MSERTNRARVETRRPAAVAAASMPPSSALLSRPAWQQHLLALAVLALALAIVFPEIALQGKIFATPDYESPPHFAAAGRAALRAGEYPLWNPFVFSGMPSYASLAFVPYVYPPSEILGFLGKMPLLPPMTWLLFYFAAAGYGVFLLLRALRCEYWPAVLGGIAFMLTPHLVSMGVFGHGSKLASVAYLPFLLVLGLELRHPGRRALWTALLGLTLGLQLLRGHPQIAFYGLLMLGTLGLVELVAALAGRVPRAEFARFAAGLAAGVGLGFGIAGVLLLPVHAYAPDSIRGAAEGGGAAYQYATNWSLTPGEIATFFLPSAAGFGEVTYVGSMPFTNFPNYLGQAVLLFGVAALVLLRGRLLVFLVVLALLALGISFGNSWSLVYDLFYHHMPFFNRFRVPVMILVLLQLAAGALLGLGASALWARQPRGLSWRQKPDARQATRATIATAVTAVILCVAVRPWSSALGDRVAQRLRSNPNAPAEAAAAYAQVARTMLQGDGLRVGAVLVLSALVLMLLWRRKLQADLAGGLLVALVLFDLGSVDRRMVQPQRTWPGVASRIGPAPRTSQPEPGPMARWLQEQDRGEVAPLRIFPAGSLFMDNEWMSWGISSVGGYHPAKLSRYQQLLDAIQKQPDPRILALLNVRYIVTPQAVQAGLQPVYDGPDGAVYENAGALPRAWVTGRWRPAQKGSCVQELQNPNLDLAHVVLLEQTPAPAPDSSATGTARVTAFGSNHVEVEVTASAPALLVLSEAWHRDWRARVDGSERPVLAADCVLRAVAVPAGTSHVRFQFTAPALRAGLGLTGASLAVLLALLGFDLLRRRRVAASPARVSAREEVPAP